MGFPSQKSYSRTAKNTKTRDTDDQRSRMAAVEEINLPYALIWKAMIEGEV